MGPLTLIANLRIQDAVDILFLTVVVYHLYLWFRGTKAFKVLVGLLALGIVFTAARTWGLFLTTWVFQIFWQVLVILLIILFQSEIRQVLERVNPLQATGLRKISSPAKWIPGFTQAIVLLAKQRIGALIIIERGDRVQEFINEGQPLEGEPSPEVLISIFQKQSPLHDGAVLIQGGRITQVACYLPLSPDEGLPKEWGTRHRAALGLSERCDAWIVVISEERGEVSIARQGEVIGVKNLESLSRLISDSVAPVRPKEKTWWERFHHPIVHKWHAKIGALLLVSIGWLLLAGQQDFEVSFQTPLKVKNVPPRLQVVAPKNPNIRITVRGLRRDASTLNENNVSAEIDLSAARIGDTVLAITRDHIRLPNDSVYVVNIDPARIAFTCKEKPTK